MNLSLKFMFELPEDKKPSLRPEDFNGWNWNLENRKKITLEAYNYNLPIDENKREWWYFTIQKTKNKGVHVSNYIKSNKPIKILTSKTSYKIKN